MPRDELNPRLIETSLVPQQSSRLDFAMMNLFAFTGDHLRFEHLMNTGATPWWLSDETSLAFWRPLSALTHWVDYRLWPHSAGLMHAHNLIWFGAGVFVVALFYRRMIKPSWIAGLAALLYMLDEGYILPVSTISNRNVLISLFFGMLTLIAHDRWRRKRSVIAGVMSPILCVLSLLAAEAGIAVFAYLFAYAIFLDTRGWRKGSVSLLPTVIPAGIWMALYNVLGYGVSKSGLYVTPFSDPLSFIAAIFKRGPILLTSQLFGPPAEMYTFLSTPYQYLFLISSVLFLTIFVILFYPLLRRDKVAAYFGVATLLSVIVACPPTFLSNRHLFFVGLGAMGLVGKFIGGLTTNMHWVSQRKSWRTSAWTLLTLLIGAHLAVAGIGRIVAPQISEHVVSTRAAMLEVGEEAELANKDLIIINSPSPFFFLYFPYQRATGSAPIPLSVRVLSPALSSLTVTREDLYTLVVKADADNILSLESDIDPPAGSTVYTLWRVNDTFSIRRFDSDVEPIVELPRLFITVLAVDDGGLPKDIAYRFEVPLEDVSLKWLQWNWQKWSYLPVTLPSIGESFTITGPFD